jgi:hypothetical protein
MTSSTAPKLKVRGMGGSVSVYADHIVVSHRGPFGGFGGDKSIPLASITSIQFRPGGAFRGYIRFGVLGAVEKRIPLLGAVRDPDAVGFSFLKNDQFARLKKYVEDLKKYAEDLKAWEQRPKSAQPNFAEQLSELVRMRDQGALTESEFAALKAKMIG